MYSAWAGTSRSTVSQRTSSTGLPRRKPAMRYSSTSGGAGTIAEKVVAGSVPMAAATSMRPSRTLVTGWVERVDGADAGGVAAEVWAMMSTRADSSPTRDDESPTRDGEAVTNGAPGLVAIRKWSR